jgi:hypothetical protein
MSKDKESVAKNRQDVLRQLLEKKTKDMSNSNPSPILQMELEKSGQEQPISKQPNLFNRFFTKKNIALAATGVGLTIGITLAFVFAPFITLGVVAGIMCLDFALTGGAGLELISKAIASLVDNTTKPNKSVFRSKEQFNNKEHSQKTHEHKQQQKNRNSQAGEDLQAEQPSSREEQTARDPDYYTRNDRAARAIDDDDLVKGNPSSPRAGTSTVSAQATTTKQPDPAQDSTSISKNSKLARAAEAVAQILTKAGVLNASAASTPDPSPRGASDSKGKGK